MSARVADLPREPVGVDDAVALVLALARPASAERIPASQAVGRRLAAPVTAPFDVWPFPRAAMDGYALRSCDTAGAAPHSPAVLRVAGAAYAGGGPAIRVEAGQAVRIATGAALPQGADAVVPFEAVEEDEAPDRDGGARGEAAAGRRVRLTRPVAPGANVFPAGEDAAAGEAVLGRGHVVGPASLGLLAAMGVGEVDVFARPRAAVLAVGDELVAAGRGAPPPGRVYDANTPALAAALEELGARVTALGVVPDDPARLEAALRAGLEYDVLVVSGGASVGDRDFTVAALARAGARVRFTRLHLKPGKTAAFAHTESCLAFALPGNPGAAMTVFWLLAAPAVRAMAGAPPEEARPGTVGARLMLGVRVRPGRPHYLWGRLASCRGVRAVWPTGSWSTAAVRSQCLANGLVVLPADVGEMPPGSTVQVLPLPGAVPAFDWLPVPTVSVVGPHDAGKTTLLEALLPELARRGVRAAALKHDVHGFVMDHEGKDTWRLARAGAAQVGIADPARAAVLWEQEGRSLDDMAALLGQGVQLVLTEGYRSARLPRIEVVPEGAVPACPPEELLAVVSREAPAPQPGWLTFAEVPALAERVQRWLDAWYRQKAETVLGRRAGPP